VEVTLKQVLQGHRALEQLEPMLLLSLFRAVEPARVIDALNLDATLTFHAAFPLWVYDAIARRGILTKDQAVGLIHRCATQFKHVGELCEEHYETFKAPLMLALTLAIADRRFVHITGADKGYISLETGEHTEEIPPTFEGVTYNLSLLATREWRRLQETKDGTDQTTAASSVEPGHASNCPSSNRG
jgi:hypothetical protein